ncbi:Peptidase C15, pyroglutamyl peptidase I, partial [Cynara cardunculus var. scolymus]
MGSEGPKRVIIHVTGFKKLNGIANNPTETIVSNLKGYIEKKGVCPGISIGSCTVLETAGEYAPPMLYKVLKSAISSDTISGSKEVVWLHMGMIDGSSKFTIERRAVNEATFLCPDELGWQPKTSCSIDAILEFLEKMKCYDAMISDDAGTFMCNYLYYHSFCFAEQKGHKSLFLHVPPFSRINKETHIRGAFASWIVVMFSNESFVNEGDR